MTPFAAAVLAALLARPVYREDVGVPDEKRAQLELVAPAIAEASNGDPFIAALLIAVGDAETHWSLRIWRNECRPFECDRGRARGLWQSHKNNYLSAADWALLGTATGDGTRLGAERAANLLRYGVHVCGREPACVLRVYAGKGELSAWPGLQSRLATFASVRGRL